MIAVIQRVKSARVEIMQCKKASIEAGLLVLLGIEEADDQTDIAWLSRKIVNMRLFDDENGVMNKSIIDIHGQLLLVSQFTLQASTKKGNRPSYIKAARPEIAIPLYQNMIGAIDGLLPTAIETGEFGADMQVTLTNDGPVTIIINTKDRK